MEIVVTQPVDEKNINQEHENPKEKLSDYSQRAQSLRAIVLGGNEGLVAITLLLIGVGSSKHDHDPVVVLITGFATLVAGALAIGTAEFVSCNTQVDIMDSQADRYIRKGKSDIGVSVGAPNPTRIALAASFAYAIAGTVPLLATSFVNDHKMRLIVLVTMIFLSMIGLGTIGASLGKAPIARSCVRVLFGGCVEVMLLVAKSEVLEAYGVLGNKK